MATGQLDTTNRQEIEDTSNRRSSVGFFTAGKLAPGNLAIFNKICHERTSTAVQQNSSIRSWDRVLAPSPDYPSNLGPKPP
jgi:hypothetical protein